MFFNVFVYVFMFTILYFQVFLILTLIENKGFHKDQKLREEADRSDPSTKPSVTIIVPIWNEEKTVVKTVLSLLDLNYPKDKLKIMVVDDGSKDNSWSVVQQFKDHPQVLLHQKENGGKYTALNYAIEHATTEYIGCLDADSFVDSEALNHIMPYFNEEGVVAVTPSMKIKNPDTILGMVQNAEYNMGIFTRKMLGLLDAQYVTPGPFSIFRRSIFQEVGLYKHAHNTEDLEMALRIQDRHYKIRNAHKAVVYTVGPRTLYKLYKQRVRWTGGFMQNALDYKKMILNPKYGNLGLLILPLAMYSIVCAMTFLAFNIYNTIVGITNAIERAKVVGFSFSTDAFTYEWILYHIQSSLILGIAIIGVVIFAIMYGKRLAGVKDDNTFDFVYFLLIYSLISPLWLVTSVWNTIRQRDAAWR
ncbi:MAG: glycosyltransferase [Candidatus Taylorbacteria bacterium]|nr:glycosyltransferase [Candidatus Taylorbacteria bacterium]